MLATCAGWAAFVLGSTSWQAAQQLNDIFPFYVWRTRTFTASDYQTAQLALAALATVLTLAGLVLLWLRPGKAAVAASARELRNAVGNMLAGLRSLPMPQRWQAAGALLGLTALRIYFSLINPEYDDAVSYEVFVSKGLLATSAFYPIPNNHVFSNTISLLFYQLSPGFW